MTCVTCRVSVRVPVARVLTLLEPYKVVHRVSSGSGGSGSSKKKKETHFIRQQAPTRWRHQHRRKTSSGPKYGIGYTHTSRTECTAFIAKLKGRAKITEEKEHTLKVYKHAVDNTAHNLAAPQYATANESLYDLIIEHLDNDELVNTLTNNYMNDGVEALRYIRGKWDTGGNGHKQKEAKRDYRGALTASPTG